MSVLITPFTSAQTLLTRSTSSKIHHSDHSTATFRSISCAALGTNLHTATASAAAVASEGAFQSSSSFSSVPLLLHPRSKKATAFQATGNNLNFRWTQGRAGEDRVHLVIFEDQKCLFAGIYDGFNCPDATDYLLSNLHASVQDKLKGLLWNEDNHERLDLSPSISDSDQNREEGKSGRKSQQPPKNWEKKQRRRKFEFSNEASEVDRILRRDETSFRKS